MNDETKKPAAIIALLQAGCAVFVYLIGLGEPSVLRSILIGFLVIFVPFLWVYALHKSESAGKVELVSLVYGLGIAYCVALIIFGFSTIVPL